jgi:hypothetical protein
LLVIKLVKEDSMSQYTKGEWQITTRDGRVSIYDESNRLLSTMIDGSLANAHLMAAAPGMYRALKKITELAPRDKLRLPYAIQVVEIAEKALTKAEGK